MRRTPAALTLSLTLAASLCGGCADDSGGPTVAADARPNEAAPAPAPTARGKGPSAAPPTKAVSKAGILKD